MRHAWAGKLRFPTVQTILIVLLCNCAYGIDLRQATVIASPGILAITLRYVDCERGTAQTQLFTGFLVTSGGLVLSAEHPFRGRKCIHEVRGIDGTPASNFGGATDSSPPLNLEIAIEPDVTNDIAFLRIKGAIPTSMQPLPLCDNFQPVVGTEYFAFGFPSAKPLTPLRVSYSSRDARNRFWIMSGLTTHGMSGGPVLDQDGNVIGLVQGGILDDDGHVYAVRYVSEIGQSVVLKSQPRLRANCGKFKVPRMVTVEEYLSPAMTRQKGDKIASVGMCGLATPTGFKLTTRKDHSELFLRPVSAGSNDPSSVGGLDGAHFFVSYRHIGVSQRGTNNGNYQPDSDIIVCAASSKVAQQRGMKTLFNDDFKLFVKIDAVLGSTKRIPETSQECFQRSGWPSKLLGGRAIESQINISFTSPDELPSTDSSPPDNTPGVITFTHFAEVLQLPLYFSRDEHTYFGSFAFFDIDHFLSDVAKENRTSGDPMRFIIDSDLEKEMIGIQLRCQSYDNIRFDDFKRACHSVLGQAVRAGRPRGDDCVVSYWRP